jgi:hypothetical protein
MPVGSVGLTEKGVRGRSKRTAGDECTVVAEKDFMAKAPYYHPNYASFGTLHTDEQNEGVDKNKVSIQNKKDFARPPRTEPDISDLHQAESAIIVNRTNLYFAV